MKQPAIKGRAAEKIEDVKRVNRNVGISLDIDKKARGAQEDGWLLALITKTAPDPATVHVAYETFRERHEPFFVAEFEEAFQKACSGRMQ